MHDSATPRLVDSPEEHDLLEQMQRCCDSAAVRKQLHSIWDDFHTKALEVFSLKLRICLAKNASQYEMGRVARQYRDTVGIFYKEYVQLLQSLGD